ESIKNSIDWLETCTQSVDLVTISSNELNDTRNKSILDRFYVDIIPRIQHNIEYFTLDSLSIDCVLRIGNYHKLHKLILVNVQLEATSHIFNEKSSIIDIFKHQISHLTITVNDGSTGICRYLPSKTCYSSSIVHLNIRVRDFDGCLRLLDGRLSQLQTFIAEVDYIYNTSVIINNTVKMNEELLPTPDDVKRALIQRGYNVNCYTDYSVFSNGQCHIYSLPFTMDRMYTHSSKFHGDLSLTVRY
ncbi:unnamed protein product, partial [Rotaria magnacalcarata]